MAVVEKTFADLISQDMRSPAITGAVVLSSYKPNHMTYEVSSNQKALAVFSEVYYGESWQAYIDGEPVPHLRANYILRALPVEKGTHTVEFKFTFRPFELGEKVSLAGSILVLLLLLGGLGFGAYKKLIRKPE